MYEKFALIYDRVMRGVDYPTWAEYVLNLAQKYGFDTAEICDLACGTGSLAFQLVQSGCKVFGVDGSEMMLAEARRKAEKEGVERIQWQQGDLRDFDLGRRFLLITCLYDSINYLLTKQDVLSCFRSVFRHLEPGGGFIFDITTEYNIISNFAEYTFAENFEDFSYIWENRYNIASKIISSDVTMFRKQGDQFSKATETHRQKIFPTAEIEKLARKAGFEVLGAFDGFTFNEPGSKVERIHFACRKKKS